VFLQIVLVKLLGAGVIAPGVLLPGLAKGASVTPERLAGGNGQERREYDRKPS
jgi:hypothetical protein